MVQVPHVHSLFNINRSNRVCLKFSTTVLCVLWCVASYTFTAVICYWTTCKRKSHNRSFDTYIHNKQHITPYQSTGTVLIDITVAWNAGGLRRLYDVPTVPKFCLLLWYYPADRKWNCSYCTRKISGFHFKIQKKVGVIFACSNASWFSWSYF